MKQALGRMRDEVANQNKDMALGVCETFNILVQQHNSKEEMILYMMADNILASSSDGIVDRMKTLA